jgi:hypothetical protein
MQLQALTPGAGAAAAALEALKGSVVAFVTAGYSGKRWAGVRALAEASWLR